MFGSSPLQSASVALGIVHNAICLRKHVVFAKLQVSCESASGSKRLLPVPSCS